MESMADTFSRGWNVNHKDKNTYQKKSIAQLSCGHRLAGHRLPVESLPFNLDIVESSGYNSDAVPILNPTAWVLGVVATY